LLFWVIGFCLKIMTPLKGGLCLVLIITGLLAIRGYPIPDDNTERSETEGDENEAGDEGGSGTGSGDDEPVAEAVKLENGEQEKKQPSIAKLFEALDDLDHDGSKGFRSLAAAASVQAPEAEAVKQEEPINPVGDDLENNNYDEENDAEDAEDGGEEEESGEENYPEDEPEADVDEQENGEQDEEKKEETVADQEDNVPKAEAVKQEEPSQDEAEAAAIKDQDKPGGETLDKLFAKLDALGAHGPRKKNKGQLDMIQKGVTGPSEQKQMKLDVFGGGGRDDERDGKQLSLADFVDKGNGNEKPEQNRDLMLDDEKEDEMAQKVENFADKSSGLSEPVVLPTEGPQAPGGKTDAMASVMKTEQQSSLPPEVTWKIIQMMKKAAKFRQHSESIFLAVGKILASYGFTGTYQPEMHNMVKESDLASDLLPKGLKNFWDGSKAAGV